MRTLLLIGAACLIAQPATAQTAAHAAGHEAQAVVVPDGTAKWGAAPAILPAGAQLAVLEGDPGKAGRSRAK